MSSVGLVKLPGGGQTHSYTGTGGSTVCVALIKDIGQPSKARLDGYRLIKHKTRPSQRGRREKEKSSKNVRLQPKRVQDHPFSPKSILMTSSLVDEQKPP